jgi:hypothetical protein
LPAYSANTVSNTSDTQLYQYSRSVNVATGSGLTYIFGVSPSAGPYQVTLKFAENSFSTYEQREFNYSVSGASVTSVSNFDIYGDAGGQNVADDKSYNNILPNSNGQIVIALTNGGASNAQINAIQIIPQPTPTATYTPCGYPGNTCTPTNTPTPTSTPSIALVYPNPYPGTGTLKIFIPLTTQSDIHVSIYTVSFRKISDQTISQQPVGQPVYLSPLDKNRNQLANGLYYIRAVYSTGQTVLKLLVLR